MTYLALTAQECDAVIYIHCYCLACLTKKAEGGGQGLLLQRSTAVAHAPPPMSVLRQYETPLVYKTCSGAKLSCRLAQRANSAVGSWLPGSTTRSRPLRVLVNPVSGALAQHILFHMTHATRSTVW